MLEKSKFAKCSPCQNLPLYSSDTGVSHPYSCSQTNKCVRTSIPKTINGVHYKESKNRHLPKFYSPKALDGEFAQVFFCQAFVLYGIRFCTSMKL